MIKFPNEVDHPHGWNSDFAHQRKVKSYQVEARWYDKYSQSIPHAYIPQTIAIGSFKEHHYLILEDLGSKGFETRQNISQEQIKKCIKWLAHFHKFYLNTPPEGLWQTGTYWHLDTRPHELAAIEDQDLKNAAALIDKKLNQAKNQSIIHGDAKLGNFLFNENAVSALDFQYVGGGVGVKDVAYFLSSVLNEDELFELENLYLDYYFSELALPEVEKEWRELYPLAWCDFYRFLKGWSPNHWKINGYSEFMATRVIKNL